MTNLVVGIVSVYVSVMLLNFVANTLLESMEDTLVESGVIIRGLKAKETKKVLGMSLIPFVNIVYFLYLFIQVVRKLMLVAYISKKAYI